ncbi:MAG TPA: DUF4058 family protein [Fimbriiglobus sp.]|nr:DUF4058 family protein [Fimbriiglobus sp.]
MPMHDWTRVEAGIFHDFHHEWISEIKRSLNRILPTDYYALAEQQAAGFGPDVLTLQDQSNPEDGPASSGGTLTATRPRPKTRIIVETPAEFYRRKKSSIAIRHVSGDRIVAMVEIVSPGNKNSVHAVRSFVEKANQLLNQKIHLLIIDPFPPGKRDPHGLHAAIWAEVEDEPYALPPEQPLMLVSYECGATTRGYLEPIAVGDELPDMPLFLEPGQFVEVPLEATYTAAWETVPLRWRRVIAPDELTS